jgi:inosose dehydratase
MAITRREFLTTVGGAWLAASHAASASSSHAASYVVSGFSRTSPAPPGMKLGYAAITWGTNVEQAIEDIGALGFRGVQLRAADSVVTMFKDKPQMLKEQLEGHHLTMPVLSSGNISIDPSREESERQTHVSHAKFMRAVGGRFLQVISERPKDRAIVAADYRRLGRLLTTLGQQVTAEGVRLVLHPHMNSLAERREEIAAVLDATDRRHVGVLFDVAHSLQGGADPVAAIRKYREWIDVLHLKDVRAGGAGRSGGSGGSDYQFVELGRGRVDLPGVFAAIDEIKFDGWAIVELDRVPDPGRTPKEAAEINKRYLVDRLHVALG